MLPFYLAVEADRETLWPLEGTVTPSFVNGDSRLQLEVQGPHIPPTKKSCVFYRSTRPLTTEPQRPLSYQSSWFRSLEKIPQCARGACFVGLPVAQLLTWEQRSPQVHLSRRLLLLSQSSIYLPRLWGLPLLVPISATQSVYCPNPFSAHFFFNLRNWKIQKSTRNNLINIHMPTTQK